MGRLPMDFVSGAYSADYVSGWVCVEQYLLVWCDSEVHVWGLDDEGMVVYPKDRPLDMASHSVGMHHDIMEYSDFVEVVNQYKE